MTNDVDRATVELKDSQRRLTDFRAELLKGGHIPKKLVEWHTRHLANITRMKVLELPVRLARDISRAWPELFATRAEQGRLEELLEKTVDDLLNDFANQAWDLAAPEINTAVSQVHSPPIYRGRGRPRKGDKMPPEEQHTDASPA